MIRTLTLLLMIALLFLAGCETIGGFGRDLEKTGNWIERTAT